MCIKTNNFCIAAEVICHEWAKIQGIKGLQFPWKTVYSLRFLIFWVTNLGKIIILYAPVDNTHQAENGPIKSKLRTNTIHREIWNFFKIKNLSVDGNFPPLCITNLRRIHDKIFKLSCTQANVPPLCITNLGRIHDEIFKLSCPQANVNADLQLE